MADDTRERVLDAAGPIFARRGCEGATVREICAAAGANLASVNYHFGSKESLYLESVRQAHEQKVQNVPLPQLPPDATREQKLHGFVRTMLTRMLGGGDGGWQTELLIREMFKPTHACTPLVEDFIRPQFERLLAIVDEFVPPQTSAADRQHLAFSIVGQCLHYRVAGEFVSLLIPEEDRASLVNIDALADHITRFSVDALAQWSPGSATSRTQSDHSHRQTATAVTMRSESRT